MDALRICHVIHDTKCGGTESMLLKLLRALRNEYDFRVLSLMGCGEIGEQIQALGIPVTALHLAEAGKAKPLRVYEAIRELRQASPDVVQTWGYHADLVGGIAARLGTTASVVWNIRHATLDPAIDSRNVLRSARLCGRMASWIPDRILLNAESAIPAHTAVGYPREKMEVIPNGFDTQRFCPLPGEGRAVRAAVSIPDDAIVLGMCGRFHPHKGQAQFVAVAKQLAQRHAKLHFLLAGRGCDAANHELADWIGNSGIQASMHLLGERDDMPAVLNAMDLYVLPSVTEGMPNVVGEAMACGVPVVATDVGDTGRLLQGHGRLVPSQDASAMVRAVEELLAYSDTERQRLSQSARQHIVDNYTLSVIAKRYTDVWNQSLQHRTSRQVSAIHAVAVPVADTQHRPKLVHVTTIPLTQWLFLRGQNTFMAEQGWDVHSVSSPGDYQQMLQQRDPVTTHALPISRQIRPMQDARSAYRLFRLFRKLRPEIVQLSTPKAALLGAIAAKLARVPVRIYQVRGLSSESETGVTRWLFQSFERFTAMLCNAHLVNAKSLLDYAQEANILRAGRIAGRGMSNGVDLTRFSPNTVPPADMTSWDARWKDDEGPVIGFLGRLTYDKGLEDIYHAWRVLRAQFSQARLLLVGPWEAENSVSAACREGLQNDPRVILTGPQNDVASFYQRMDIFVYPSHGTEGFPNAPMEAAAMELPVIATRVVGCVDAVADGETGFLISPRAPHELEAQLRKYFEQPLLRKRHGRAGRERIRTGFAPEDLWQEFHDYYMHLLRREQLNLPKPARVPPAKRAA